MTNHDCVVVTTTLDAEDKARNLAAAAVRARLAACAQVYAVSSVYWWEGEVRSGDEWRIDFKTRTELSEQLGEFIADHHEYEAPEVVGVPVVTGSRAYLDWVRSETAQD